MIRTISRRRVAYIVQRLRVASTAPVVHQASVSVTITSLVASATHVRVAGTLPHALDTVWLTPRAAGTAAVTRRRGATTAFQGSLPSPAAPTATRQRLAVVMACVTRRLVSVSAQGSGGARHATRATLVARMDAVVALESVCA